MECIWEMEMIKDFHDLYLKCDVLLLADVFEKLRYNRFKNYGLCRSYYLSAPTLSWDVLLNMTEFELELTSYTDIYLLFEKGMRSGVSYIYKTYSQANNKYLKSYDPKQESKNIIYLDSNKLYGYGISKFLPTAEFKWIAP